MKYPQFKLESYLAKREFVAPYNLCASDLETHSMHEIIQMADKEGKKLWEDLELSYTETEGNPLLRDEVSKLYTNEVHAENILCFAGAEEGIYCAFQTLLTSQDHAIVITPCYQSLESIPASISLVTKVKLEYEKNWQLDIHTVEKAIRSNTKLIIINFPHNPTGALISAQQQQELIALARKHNLWIFSDEVYRLLEINPEDRIAPFASVYERGISLSVMSKAYGLAGLRIGWIACQDTKLLKQMNELKHYLSICNSAPSEILALIALRASNKIHERNQMIMNKNLLLLEDFFQEYNEWFEWVKPKGGCIGYPLFKGKGTIEQFADALLNEQGALILPSTIYEENSKHFRIGFGRKSFPIGLEKFIAFIEKYKNQWNE